MIIDTKIRVRVLKALVEAERLLTLILRTPLDYRIWQKKLWSDSAVDELSQAAMQLRSFDHKPS